VFGFLVDGGRNITKLLLSILRSNPVRETTLMYVMLRCYEEIPPQAFLDVEELCPTSMPLMTVLTHKSVSGLYNQGQMRSREELRELAMDMLTKKSK